MNTALTRFLASLIVVISALAGLATPAGAEDRAIDDTVAEFLADPEVQDLLVDPEVQAIATYVDLEGRLEELLTWDGTGPMRGMVVPLNDSFLANGNPPADQQWFSTYVVYASFFEPTGRSLDALLRGISREGIGADDNAPYRVFYDVEGTRAPAHFELPRELEVLVTDPEVNSLFALAVGSTISPLTRGRHDL